MYPLGDLPGNLAAFCGVLRRDHGFRLGPGQINDAARVLQAIDLTDERHVRHAWRAILSSSRDTAAVFDDAFEAFERASKLSPALGDDLYFKMGNIAFKRRDHARARECWHRPSTVAPALACTGCAGSTARIIGPRWFAC